MAPSSKIEVWRTWNTEIPAGDAINDGPVIDLAEVVNRRRCEFVAQFTVPTSVLERTSSRASCGVTLDMVTYCRTDLA
jgi:hypothetical protein